MQVEKNKKIIIEKTNFNLVQTLECGQVFSYYKENENYIVQSADKVAVIEEKDNVYIINTTDTDYFINYFDFNTDYIKIKQELEQISPLDEAIKFGYGIKILKQDIFETIISFIISANNNIKRIKNILFKLRQNYGKKIGEFYAFPTLSELKNLSKGDFVNIGAGYRAKYLVEVVKQLESFDIEKSKSLSTVELRKNLINLSGVGPKVADCILLFAYSRFDVFPVDTWIEKLYNQFFEQCNNREKIRDELVNKFGLLSGYAQQYLFFYKRSYLK